MEPTATRDEIISKAFSALAVGYFLFSILATVGATVSFGAGIGLLVLGLLGCLLMVVIWLGATVELAGIAVGRVAKRSHGFT